MTPGPQMPLAFTFVLIPKHNAQIPVVGFHVEALENTLGTSQSALGDHLLRSVSYSFSLIQNQ